MKRLNVIQKLIACVAACISLVAVFALCGSGYSQWTYTKGSKASSECADLSCGLTVWYHSVTVYDPNNNILWQKTNYTNGETVSINDAITVETDNGSSTLTLAKSVYNYLEPIGTFKRASLADENGTEVCSFRARTTEEEYLTLGSNKWVLSFHDIDLSEIKNYKFKLVIEYSSAA